MTDPSDDLGPEDAANRIREVDRKVQSYRRLYLGGVVTLGVLTLAYFALVGAVSRDALQPYMPLFILAPIVLFPVILRFRQAGGNRSAILPVEQRLASVYIATLLVAIAVDIFLLEQGTWVAALPGLLPACVCFAGGVVLARRT